MKKEETKHNRTQRREIDRISLKFEGLMLNYLHYRAQHGNGDGTKNYRAKLDESWRRYCVTHNRSKKAQTTADPDAFYKQIEAKHDMEKVLAQTQKVKQADKWYKRWLRMMAVSHPKLLRKYKFINHFKKGDYVYTQFEKFEGNSPKGSWI